MNLKVKMMIEKMKLAIDASVDSNSVINGFEVK